MLVPDMEVGRLSLINCWNNATTKYVSFHGVTPFYLITARTFRIGVYSTICV